MTHSVFDFSSQFEHNRHALLNELVRGIEEALVPFQIALDGFLARLSEDVLPSNWREQWEAFVIEQQTQGFTVDPTSVTEMETWIESWAKEFDLWPEEERVQHGSGKVEPAGNRTRVITLASTKAPSAIEASQRTRAAMISPRRDSDQACRRPLPD